MLIYSHLSSFFDIKYSYNLGHLELIQNQTLSDLRHWRAARGEVDFVKKLIIHNESIKWFLNFYIFFILFTFYMIQEVNLQWIAAES